MSTTIQSSEELKNIMICAKKKAAEHKKKNNSLYFLYSVYSNSPNYVLPILRENGILLAPVPNEREDRNAKYVSRYLTDMKERRRMSLDESDDVLRAVHQEACLAAFHAGSPTVNSLFYMKSLIERKDTVVYRVFQVMEIDLYKLRNSLLRRIATLPRDPDAMRRSDAGAGPDSTGTAVGLGLAGQGATAPRPINPVYPPTGPLPGIPSDPRASTAPPTAPNAPGSSYAAPAARTGAVGASPSGGYASPAGESTAGSARLGGGATPMAGPRVAIPMQRLGQKPGAAAPQGLTPEEVERHQRWGVDGSAFPLLSRITRNLTLEAASGKIDPVIGRRKEVEQMIHVLKKRRANNPVLVGDPGVGKTALVEGLALDIVNEAPHAVWLKDKVLLSLETSAIVAGTQLRGSFSEKMLELREEVKRAEGRFIIFIDEIHTIVGAGAGETALDAANELKAVLARGEFPCIGATTLAEYKKYIEKDPALERRFQPVFVEEPSLADAVEICKGIIGFYEKHHQVQYSQRAIEAAVRLSSRYLMDRKLPDKAIDLLDTAGAATFVDGAAMVTEQAVARVVASKVGIPVERLMQGVGRRFSALEEFLGERIVGHQEAIRRIAETIKRGFAGFVGARPLASFLWAGAPGVGKSEIARALAEFLFNSRDAVLTFEMAEFTEKHSVGKLIGTAPGYVGHEEGGRLTEAMYRRPFQILLFRDVGVAHPDVQEILAQLLRTGMLTDGKGRRVYFSNAIIVLTQSVEPGRLLTGDRPRMGFTPTGPADTKKGTDDVVLRDVRKGMVDTLFDGPDERLVFRPLSQQEVVEVVRREVAKASRRLKEERNISFSLAPAAVDFCIRSGGFSEAAGAKDLRQTLSRTIESFLADQILDGVIESGEHVVVDWEDELVFTSGSPDVADSTSEVSGPAAVVQTVPDDLEEVPEIS